MSQAKRYARKQAKARQRRRLNAQERLERDRRQAQQAAEALHQALEELGLPETLVSEIEGRLQSQQKLLSKIVGVMFPALFGCRTPSELCRVRGWDKNWPSRLLHALPKRSWLKRLRRLGLEVLVPLWRHVATKSAATQSRWQWTWAVDDSVWSWPHEMRHPLEGSLSRGEIPPLHTFCIFFCCGMLHGIPLPSCRLRRARIFSAFGCHRAVAPHQTPIRIKAR